MNGSLLFSLMPITAKTRVTDKNRMARSGMSPHGPTRTSGDVRLRAAVKGIAEINRVPIRSAPIYDEYTSFRKL